MIVYLHYWIDMRSDYICTSTAFINCIFRIYLLGLEIHIRWCNICFLIIVEIITKYIQI